MIYHEQLKRLGYMRTIIGGFCMYLSAPFLVIFHLINIKFFLDWIAGYTLDIPKLDIGKFLVIDRYKHSQLSIMDKLNCAFCGYATGLATYFEARISQIYLYSDDIPKNKKLFFRIGLVLYHTSKALYLIHGYLLYRCIIFIALSHTRCNIRDMHSLIREKGLPTAAKNEYIRSLLPNEIIFSTAWLDNLEQIESAWCPIQHTKEDATYPRHHKNFYSIDDLDKAISQLREYGTVSTKNR